MLRPLICLVLLVPSAAAELVLVVGSSGVPGQQCSWIQDRLWCPCSRCASCTISTPHPVDQFVVERGPSPSGDYAITIRRVNSTDIGFGDPIGEVRCEEGELPASVVDVGSSGNPGPLCTWKEDALVCSCLECSDCRQIRLHPVDHFVVKAPLDRTSIEVRRVNSTDTGFGDPIGPVVCREALKTRPVTFLVGSPENGVGMNCEWDSGAELLRCDCEDCVGCFLSEKHPADSFIVAQNASEVTVERINAGEKGWGHMMEVTCAAGNISVPQLSVCDTSALVMKLTMENVVSSDTTLLCGKLPTAKSFEIENVCKCIGAIPKSSVPEEDCYVQGTHSFGKPGYSMHSLWAECQRLQRTLWPTLGPTTAPSSAPTTAPSSTIAQTKTPSVSSIDVVSDSALSEAGLRGRSASPRLATLSLILSLLGWFAV